MFNGPGDMFKGMASGYFASKTLNDIIQKDLAKKILAQNKANIAYENKLGVKTAKIKNKQTLQKKKSIIGGDFDLNGLLGSASGIGQATKTLLGL